MEGAQNGTKINGNGVGVSGMNGHGSVTNGAVSGEPKASTTVLDTAVPHQPGADQRSPGELGGTRNDQIATGTRGKRVGSESDPNITKDAKAPSPDAKLDAVRAVVHRAQRGDASALPELRRHIAEHPEYFAGQGDLSQMAQQVWLRSFTNKNLFLGEVIERDLGRLRRELTRVDATPVERLMVDNVVSCWRQLQFAEMIYAATLDKPESARKNLLKCQESAQRRYADSLQQLDKMQRRRPTAAKSPKASAADTSSKANGPAAFGASDDPLMALGRPPEGKAARGATSASPHTARVNNAEVSDFPRISPDHEADALLNGVGVDD